MLISFENEHILMWRGQGWKSSLPELKSNAEGVKKFEADTATSVGPILAGQAESLTTTTSSVSNSIKMNTSIEDLNPNSGSWSNEDVDSDRSREPREEVIGDLTSSVTSALLYEMDESQHISCPVDLNGLMDVNGSIGVMDGSPSYHSDMITPSPGSETRLGSSVSNDNYSEPPSNIPSTFNKFEDVSENTEHIAELPSSIAPSVEGVSLLLKQAVESGSAVVLEDSSLDADAVYEKAVALAKSAPPGPVFRRQPKNVLVQGCDKHKSDDLEVKEADKASEKEVIASSRTGILKKNSRSRSMKDIREDYLNTVPQGSLRVDELAKLLA